MLERLDLPNGIFGIRASGTVTRDDYERVLAPALEEARLEGRRLRVLYQFSTEFQGFTPSGAWEDTRIGLRYLRLFDRCAVVTDVDWLKTATRAVAPLMPCPTRTFANADYPAAVDWLGAPVQTSLTFRMVPEQGVLVIEPHGPLGPDDFDALTATADAWMESSSRPLRGIVIYAREFPGWENLGGLLRHIRFVREHHRKIRRVALATDSTLAGLASSLVDHFVAAEIKRYDYEDVDLATTWAGRAPAATGAQAPT